MPFSQTTPLSINKILFKITIQIPRTTITPFDIYDKEQSRSIYLIKTLVKNKKENKHKHPKQERALVL